MIVLDTHVWLWWVNLDKEHLKPDWLARIDSSEVVGVSVISCFEVAWLAVDLPEHHRDPQDRLIIATTLTYEATLISVDARFPLYVELNGRLLN